MKQLEGEIVTFLQSQPEYKEGPNWRSHFFRYNGVMCAGIITVLPYSYSIRILPCNIKHDIGAGAGGAVERSFSRPVPAKSGQWTNIKPDGTEECVFVSATKWTKEWTYAIWEIKKVDGPDGWYLGLCDGDGEEWGGLEDLRADLYMILPKHEQ